MEITLARFFNVMNVLKEATALVVHLADFDEEWVLKTAGKLHEGFTKEAMEGNLHVIHAPRDLYPLRQAESKSFELSGFQNADLNGKYSRLTATDQVSYASASRQHLGEPSQ